MSEMLVTTHRIETSGPSAHSELETLDTQAVIDALARLHRSNNRYLDKHLEILFQDTFLVRAIDSDRHAAWQIHEATGLP
jgi:hypothetical protein